MDHQWSLRLANGLCEQERRPLSIRSLPLHALHMLYVHTCVTCKCGMIIFLCVWRGWPCVLYVQYAHVCPVLVHVEASRGCPSPLTCGYRDSRWTWSSPFGIGWPTSELLEPAFLHAHLTMLGVWVCTSILRFHIGARHWNSGLPDFIHREHFPHWAPKIAVFSVSGRIIISNSAWGAHDACLLFY